MSGSLTPVEFELARDGDLWVALHVESGVASQGATPSEAVAMAQEAADLSRQEHHAGDDEHQERMLEECGIDPSAVSRSIESPDGMP